MALFFLMVGCLTALEVVTEAFDSSSLEATVAASYVDRGVVSSHMADGIHYLAAGPVQGNTVIFCHGAAFTSKTWQITGVLDALAEQHFRVLAIDVPGYGTYASGRDKPSKSDKATLLHRFADKLNLLADGHKVVVVTASMGGSVGLPLVIEDLGKYVAGYVTVAGDTTPFKKYEWTTPFGDTKALDIPALLIFGDKDERAKHDPQVYKKYFSKWQVHMMKDAPHPAYLRDVEAASEFTRLVVKFVGEAFASAGTASNPAAAASNSAQLLQEQPATVPSQQPSFNPEHSSEMGAGGVSVGLKVLLTLGFVVCCGLGWTYYSAQRKKHEKDGDGNGASASKVGHPLE